MADLHRPDDLASLRARLDAQESAFTTRFAAQDAAIAAQRTQIARLKRRRRLPRRALTVILAALLVALIPLATYAANPFFADLGEAAAVHRDNIQAIGNAGITTGFENPADPSSRLYSPKGLVTREEMASFLARAAGLGTNPPVANALTAQTAVNAQTATNATAATTAQNAAALGGQPPSAYLPSSGDTTIRYPGASAILRGSVATVTYDTQGGVSFDLVGSNSTGTLTLPLARPTALFGRPLGVSGVRVCYTAPSGVAITRTVVASSERGAADGAAIIDDVTPRPAATATCYTIAVAPQARAAQNTLILTFNNPTASTQNVTLHSVALTLTPLAAGAAVVPGEGSGQPDKPQP